MVDGEKGGCAEDGFPTSPLAVQRAEEILLCKGRKADGHDHVPEVQVWNRGHLLLGLANKVGGGRNMLEQQRVAFCSQAQSEAATAPMSSGTIMPRSERYLNLDRRALLAVLRSAYIIHATENFT